MRFVYVEFISFAITVFLSFILDFTECEAISITKSNNYSGIARFRRQSCGGLEFPCNSGQCIATDLQCDGKDDCADGSDETDDCKTLPCPAYLFQCRYGACVNGNAECDGKQDCKDNSDETSAKCGTSTSDACGAGKYRCSSGECIDDWQLCDGTAQCSDNGDESEKECSNFPCPSFTYKCKYGACVSGNARCNGLRECFDGSDEAGCGGSGVTDTPVVTTTTRSTTQRATTQQTQATSATPSTPGSCVLPNHPEDGQWVVRSSTPVALNPGDSVSEFTVVQVTCNRRHKAHPTNTTYCIAGSFTNGIPKCYKTCRSIANTKSTTAKCTLKGVPLPNCDDPLEGTIATLKCEPLYEEPGLSLNPTRICKDGTWDFPLSRCTAVCGQKTPKGNTNVIGGTLANKGDYPWQVGIYLSKIKKHICGGSVLNQRVIISAAHCFTDYSGQLSPIEDYAVTAGKYYIGYDDPRDEHAQYATIENIFIPERYKGVVSFFESDLAIVVIKGKFDITRYVQPVCVDWSNDFEYEQFSENQVGVVTGWGYTKEGEDPSPELKEIQVPYVSYSACFEQVPSEFRAYLTHDKVCAGFLHEGRSVCQGDSGGGLVFKNKIDRFYIRGIVSTSPASNGSCDSNQYGTYTKISSHIEFVRTNEVQYRP